MKIFIDTANVNEIKKAAELGIIDMINHPLTDRGIAKFLEDYNSSLK